MANTVYPNFYLSNEVEDQYKSHLDLQQFCTVDNNLVGTPGMIRKINVYKATDGTEKLTMGNGNTKSIEVGYTQKQYEILLAQNRFKYYDEQAMTDPQLVPVGTRHMGTDMFNTVNKDIYAEFAKATQVVVGTKFNFDMFADAQSVLALENLEDVTIFAFVSPADVADIRKELKDTLQYVEAFAKNGYVGTVAGVNIYTKKDATSGSIYIGTKEAVTLFNKKGVEIEQERDANTRENSIFSRKYYLAALTNETKVVKIFKGTATAATATTAAAGTTYYAKVGNGYVAVTPATGDSPKDKGFSWYLTAPMLTDATPSYGIKLLRNLPISMCLLPSTAARAQLLIGVHRPTLTATSPATSFKGRLGQALGLRSIRAQTAVMPTALHTVGLPFNIVSALMTLRGLRVIIKRVHPGRSSTINRLLSPGQMQISAQKAKDLRKLTRSQMQTMILSLLTNSLTMSLFARM